jgi:nucleotide-binding universal stress UspA family protein
MRILLASDGSPAAITAAEWLAACRLPEQCSIGILSVAPMPAGRFVPGSLGDSLRDEARAAAERTRAALGIPADVHVTTGDAREEIVRMADDLDVDLVVMGARGLGRAVGFLLGTVSLAVVRDSARPVLVVRGRRRGLRSAVVALDGSEHALAALRVFARLPRRGEVVVHLAGVVEEVTVPRTAPKAIRAELQAAAQAAERERRQALEQALEAASSQLPGAKSTATVVTGDPAEEILRIADEKSVDAIVVGARGLGAVKRLALGSVSETILREARCAVLIAKRPEQ